MLDNLDWLEDEVSEYADDYIVIDCPGQIELYTHIPILPKLAQHFQLHLDFRMCAVYLLESAFMINKEKFFAGVMSAMSAMLMLEMPHVNVLSKMDLVKGQLKRSEIKRFLHPDASLLNSEMNAVTNKKYHRLNEALVQLIDDFSMVSFLPLDSTEEDSVDGILSYIDDTTQWAEDQV